MAIAFDAISTGGSVNPGTSVTYSHVCSSGSNRALFVLTRGGTSEGDRISGVTYGGVAMAKIDDETKPTENSVLSLWYLLNPASGDNNVVVTLSSGFMTSIGISYTGVKQSAQPDSSNTATGASGTSLSMSTTTVADNCWTVCAVRGQGTLSAGAGTTSRVSVGGDNNIMDSNSVKTPAGSSTLVANGSEGTWVGVVASFSPSVEGGAFLFNMI